MIERFRVFQLILILHVTGQLHILIRAKYHRASAFTPQIPTRTKISSRVTATTCYTTNHHHHDHDQDQDHGDKREVDIGDRPRYRSNLQRLNQASTRAPSKQLNNDSKSTSNINSNSNRKLDEPEEQPDYKKQKEPEKKFDPSYYEDDIPFPPSNEEYSIDSFLRGEYDRPYSEDAAAPHPELSPSETIGHSLHALRDLDTPEISHGAAVFARFLAPLSRSERWGGSVSGATVLGPCTVPGPCPCPWKEIMRGSLTPTNFARRIRASDEFSVLLDWETIDVTEGLAVPVPETNEVFGSTIAFVHAALFFRSGVEPSIVQFTLRKISGVWLIESAVISKKEWFVDDE